MPEIILHDAVVADDWQVLRPAADEAAAKETAANKPVVVPPGRVIVPLAVWLDQQGAGAPSGGVTCHWYVTAALVSARL